MSPVHTPRPCPATSQVQALSRAYCLDLGLHPAPLSPAPAQPGGSELAARLLWELGKQTPYLSLSGKSSKPLLLLWMECLEDLEPCVLEASGISASCVQLRHTRTEVRCPPGGQGPWVCSQTGQDGARRLSQGLPTCHQPRGMRGIEPCGAHSSL